MLIQQIYTNNQLRNFNYVIACAETGQALAVDPSAAELCYQTAKTAGWDITHILNTHEHWDHIDGNTELVAKTGAKILAHHKAIDTIPNVDRGLKAGDIIRIGNSVELEMLDTPGHTMAHICILAHTREQCPALFSGDTLFNAGCGNCCAGGDPKKLFTTFSQQLANLPNTTLVYPGHDYLLNNLRFSLSREPDNSNAKQLFDQLQASNYDPNNPYVSTMAIEKDINPFFRLGNHAIISQLRVYGCKLSNHPSPEEVFIALRACRDKW